GEVHDIARAGTANGQRPAQRLKDHLLAIRLEAFHDDCGGRQGGVTTELYFDCRCEPAQMMFRPGCYEKGGLGEIVLGRDCLHRGDGQELLEYDDCCRVSREPLRREGVELKDGRTHGGTLRSHAWTRDGDYANEHAPLPREQVSVFAGGRGGHTARWCVDAVSHRR